MLTRKQYQLLCFIDKRVKATGVAPSFDEMKDALDLKSKSGIHRLIKALEERGFIRRLPHRARALEVVRLPDAPGATEREARPAPRSDGGQVIQADFRRARRNVELVPDRPSASEVVDIPLHGRIAAGTPIEALQQDSVVSVPATLLGRGEHFALEVMGESMVDAGILEGDTVIIRRCDSADSGDIVVALVNGVEATLKTLRKRGSQVALEPSNTGMETQIYPAGKVKVQGRLVGLLRRY